MYRLLTKLKSLHISVQFITLFAALSSVWLISEWLFTSIDPNAFDDKPFDNESPSTQFTVGVLIGPLIETYLSQYFPIVKLKKYISRFRYRFIFSSVLFGLLHYYSIYYIIVTVGIGLILALPFALYPENNKTAFRFCWMLHLLNNLIVFVGNCEF